MADLRFRDRVLLRPLSSLSPSSLTPLAALPGKVFPIDDNEVFTIQGRTLILHEVQGRAHEGTGLCSWDGAVVLAKYLEHAVPLSGLRVLELGTGTGVVGMAAAALGAIPTLTDLDYCLHNVRNNLRLNHFVVSDGKDDDEEEEEDARKDGPMAFVTELDWTTDADTLRRQFPGQYDLLIASDVVWLEELVQPYVSTVATLLHASGCSLLMSYQSRSKGVDTALMQHFEGYNLSVRQLPQSEHHPIYQSEIIQIYRIDPA
jgi:predicted nicotinamide N-methyase